MSKEPAPRKWRHLGDIIDLDKDANIITEIFLGIDSHYIKAIFEEDPDKAPISLTLEIVLYDKYQKLCSLLSQENIRELRQLIKFSCIRYFKYGYRFALDETDDSEGLELNELDDLDMLDE